MSRRPEDPEVLEIVPYDPGWVRQFEEERARLQATLGEVALRIEHHGSTSVPGLAAKPVIDIQVSVQHLQPLARYAVLLAELGYIHVPHPDDAFAPFFHRPARWPHTHHIHVVAAGGAWRSRRRSPFETSCASTGTSRAPTKRSRRRWR